MAAESTSCSCPGFIGATLGGGLTRWSGIYGLISDALDSVRLVSADGRLLNVSNTSYPDLFWGLRGAGQNFGIVTSATYKLHSPDPITQGKIVSVDFVFPAANVPAYFKALSAYSRSMPAKMAAISLVTFNSTANAVSLRSYSPS